MASRMVIVLFLSLVGLGSFRFQAQAQSAPLATGQTSSLGAEDCDPSLGFWMGNANHPTHCYKASISCSGTDDILIHFARTYETGPNGTIVLLSGAGGTVGTAYPGVEAAFAQDYVNDSYQVVQTAWQVDWENVNSGPQQHAPFPYSIKTAACRPATFLKWVHDNLLNSPLTDPTCAQGASAGSAAVAYSLAWYGAADYLDKVELSVGPVFSDIDRGCKVTGSQDIVTVCPSNQTGCVGWGSGVPVWVQYRQGAQTGVREWSGDSSCAGPNNTSSSSSQKWKAMSIDDGTNNWTKTYPNTDMSAWLCASVDPTSGSMNNSSPEGQLYYTNIIPGTREYRVNAVTNCQGPEGVFSGMAPDGSTGHDAIHRNMSQIANPSHCRKIH